MAIVNRLITVLLIVFLGLTFFLPIYYKDLGKKIDGDQLDAPISLSPQGYVESVVHIPMKAPYEISLMFLDDENDEAAKLRKAQIAIPVHLEIYSLPDHKPVMIKENMAGTTAWRSRKYYQRIIAYSEQFMEEGNYKVIAYVLQDVPEAENIPVHLQMAMETEYVFHNYFGIDIVLGAIFWPLVFIDIILIIIFLVIKFIQWD